MKNAIKLSKENRDDMISSIKNYFAEEREEEIGDLSATLILNFFMEELALPIYNQGVYDAYTYMNDRVEDILGLQK